MTQPIYDAWTFWDLLNRRVAATPDRMMLVDEAGRSLTFAEFRDQAERVAAGLLAMGVTEGTPVTWVLPTRIETVLTSFALSRLGAVQNPIIHIYRRREVEFCIRQTRAELVVHPGVWNGFDYGSMVDEIVAGLHHGARTLTGYDDLPEGDPATLAPVPESGGGDTVRWLYYTSGTTSDPKGVKHTDASLIAGGVGLARALDMSGDDVGSIAFPYAHIGGPDYMVTMLAAGFGAVLVERFNPAEAVMTYARHGVTMAGGSTAFYQMFLDEDRKSRESTGGPAMPALRVLSGGGAPKPPEIYFRVKEQMGVPVAHGYGMTECPMISQGSPRDNDHQLAYTDGRPVHGCDVSIVAMAADGGEAPAPAGVQGEVRVSGPMLFSGYTDPTLDRTAFDARGRFRTGDLGVLSPDGHLTLTGRVKDIIIRKGENISAKEIEDVLYAHEKVGSVAVIGLTDRTRGERVCAVVETAPDSDDLTFEEMVEACLAAGLARQKVPEQLEIHPGPLPRNATLKILKHKLREVYETRRPVFLERREIYVARQEED
ncbi:MAG: AMP-binding protein [Acidimicrobiaceae bacterium]|nr:AMP-binding protein [Acidimicrobiaceae bacterium]MYE08981.1 AMP-binding protein [Acidimicrobiaceae bacterium]MYI37220.1 AMP-binding protein [Acidimicrobiaceae bacterium]